MDPAKLKVVELRAELSHRGLDTKGNKAVLVERLRAALEKETGDHVEETVLKSDVVGSAEDMATDVREKTPEPVKPQSPVKTPGRSARNSSSSSPSKTPSRVAAKAAAATTMSPTKQPPSPVKVPPPDEPGKSSPVPEKQNTSEEPEVLQKLDETAPLPEIAEDMVDPPVASPKSVTQTESAAEIVKEPEGPSAEVLDTCEESPCDRDAPIVQPQEEEPPVSETPTEDSSTEHNEVENSITDPDAKPDEEEPKGVPDVEANQQVSEQMEEPEDDNDDSPDEKRPEDKEVTLTEEEKESKEEEDAVKQEKVEDEVKQEKVEESSETEEQTDQKDLHGDGSIKEELDKNEETSAISSTNLEPLVPGEEGSEEQILANCKVEKTDYMDYDERTTKPEEQDVEMKDSRNDDDSDAAKDRNRKDRKDRKRKRSTSPQQEQYRSPPPVKPDDEPEIDDGVVSLSWYDSDLNLMIDKNHFCSATPMHNDGFGYIWAGTRASFGFRAGKLYYETKVTENCNISLQDEENPHVLRVGWSVAGTSMQLGEEKFSYGYGGTGKASTECKFRDYGRPFGKDDIVGCYADFTGETQIDLSFTVNGENQGVAFSISKEEIGDVALYPHILSKNCAFGCNFGQEEPWNTSILDGFIPIGEVDPQERITGPRRPERKEDCEMILMCGLPAAGKTQWALQYAALHPEKMYNILGTNSLIEKMKVMGLPRKRNYHGRWEVLIDKCTRALNKLLEIASTKRRNYILDQTNVYPSAQRRKMRHFYGFQRKAVVVVPTDEEFKLRTAKREAIEGKDVPDSAVLEMKANFSAPTLGESFEAIEYVELEEEEAKKLIEKYNKEGKEAGFSHQQVNKRPRFEKADSHRDSRDSRSSRDSRDSRDHRDRRGGYPDRNRNLGGWRGGNNGGGWRDRQQRGGVGASSGGNGSGGSSGGGGHPRHGGTSGGSGYGTSSSGGGWRGGRGGAPIASHRGGNDRRGGVIDRRTTGGSDRNRNIQQRQGGGWGSMGYQSSQQQQHPQQQPHQQQQQSGGGWGQQGGWSSGQSQQQSGWGQQGGWGQQQWGGGWKGFGQNSYNQSGYSQQNYGNGNWGSWNQQQYYNQYWGQQQQQQSSQTAVAGSGQTATTVGGSTSTSAGATNTASGYSGYPQGWQGYTQGYAFQAQTTGNSQQAQQQK